MTNPMHKQSLYVTLGIIIILSTVIVMSIQAAYSYVTTKTQLVEEMKYLSKISIDTLQKNISKLISSYSINEYNNLVANEMASHSYYSIVIEDYNMGKILGKKAHISGKILDTNGKIINFNDEDKEHNKKLTQIYYSVTNEIINTSSGEKIGSVTIYITSHSINEALNEIIIATIVNALIISLILILLLFLTIRSFILQPISKIIAVINDCDENGLPIKPIPHQGSTEILSLSKRMNDMILSIKDSRIILDTQNKELKEHKEQLQILSKATEQSPVSIIICNPDNQIEYVNPQFEKTSGYTSDEIIGTPIEYIFNNNKKNISQIEEINKTLSLGEMWVGELTPYTKDKLIYSIRIFASSIFHDDQTISHFIYVADDITEYKRNEEILRNSQKMDAIGQLTGGIAHDFNNLLGIIIGNLELLELDLNDKPNELEKIKSALAGADRGANLIRKLLNFSRQDNQRQELTQINFSIQNLHDLIAKSVTAAIQVEIHLEENLWLVEIDPGDLEDAILNLSLNARDSMPKGGSLIIETANKSLDANYVNQNPGSWKGDFVMVTVSDTGTGISKITQEKIFDPFFTTKEFGKGTGLGLSMVYGFVQRSHGHIKLYSEVGHGSSFHIYLPRSKNEQKKNDVETEIKMPTGTESILIVDDEKPLTKTVESYLQHLGYKTLVAYSGRDALDIISKTNEINLMFSDIVMPKMGGFELSLEVIKQYPAIKILLTSGFSSKQMKFSEEKGTLNKLSKNLLKKPFNMQELAIAIRRTLDE